MSEQLLSRRVGHPLLPPSLTVNVDTGQAKLSKTAMELAGSPRHVWLSVSVSDQVVQLMRRTPGAEPFCVSSRGTIQCAQLGAALRRMRLSGTVRFPVQAGPAGSAILLWGNPTNGVQASYRKRRARVGAS